MEKTRAVILAGGEGTRLGVLTAKRAKPSVPFAGKYRIIDFVLSNCVNSDIFDVLVLTQYRPHSLNKHMSRGQPWDLDRTLSGGMQILQPYLGRHGTTWYKGTADAVTQNLNFVRRGSPEHLLILSGDHIYKQNYRNLIRYHEEHNADVTICVIDVPLEEAHRFGIMFTDDDLRVKEFFEKPQDPPGTLANMGVYIFRTPILDYYLTEDDKNPNSKHDFGKDIIPKMIDDGRKVMAYPYNDYWVDVGTMDAYWEAHMDLLKSPPELDLNDRTWIIHTRSEERPPVKIEGDADVTDSFLTDGTVVRPGAIVERSVLSPGVYIGEGAIIRDSIIFTDTRIEDGSQLSRVISDKQVSIGPDCVIGDMDGRLTVIGKNAQIPAGYTIGGNVIVGSDCIATDFDGYENRNIPDGTRVNYFGPDKS